MKRILALSLAIIAAAAESAEANGEVTGRRDIAALHRWVGSEEVFTVDSTTYGIAGNGIVHVRRLIDTGDYGRNCSMTGSVTIPASVSYDGKEYKVTAIDLWDGEYISENGKFSYWPATYYWTPNVRPTVVLSEGVDSIINLFPVRYLSDLWLPKTFKYIGDRALFSKGDVSPYFNGLRVHAADLESWCTIDVDPANVDRFRMVPWGADFELYVGDDEVVSLKIPQSVTELEPCAFACANSIRTVRLHGAISKIGVGAFYSCEDLKSAELQQGIKEVSPYLFNMCKSLSRVSLPKGLKKIGDYAFSECSSLEHIDIPNEVDSIGNNAFSCTNIQNVDVPGNVETIGDYAFESCRYLSYVRLHMGTQSIGQNAFRYCKRLSKIELPGSLRQIKSNAFEYCRSLKEIVLPASVEEIQKGAFGDCSSLTDVYCLSEIPPTTENSGDTPAFPNYGSGINLYVPAKSIERYMANPNWVMFSISPIETTDIKEVEKSAGQDEIRFYDVSGQYLGSGTSAADAKKFCASGSVVIMRGDSGTRKIVVK